MKKLLCLLMCGFICLSLAACGGKTETAKSAELKNQYYFYETSIKKIIDGTKVTAEQADEIFIILVSCGLDNEITSVYKNNLIKEEDTYSYYWSGNVATYNFVLNNGVVQKVLNGESILYPESEVKKQEEEQASSEKEKDISTMTVEEAVDFAIENANAEKIEVSFIDKVDGVKSAQLYMKCKENLTDNMTKDGMLIQATKILKTLKPRDDIGEIWMFWSAKLVDEYGKTSDWNVLKIQITADTLKKINFDNFISSNIPDIADEYYIHSSFKK